MICLKIRTFVVSATTGKKKPLRRVTLWFAWKFVPLWYQQQHYAKTAINKTSCDLLENSYLCGISNNRNSIHLLKTLVVICLKIRTFVVSATTYSMLCYIQSKLWFAWKFVPLWYQQQPQEDSYLIAACCDLLENSYLCGISNNYYRQAYQH